MQAVCEISLVANVVEASDIGSDSRGARGGRLSSGFRGGRGFRPRVQCQICHRFGHVAQRCYYRFDRAYGSSVDGASVTGGDEYGWFQGVAPEQHVEGRSWGPHRQMDPGDPYFVVSQPAWAGHFGGLVSGIFSPHVVQYANRPYFGPYSSPFRPNGGQGPSRNLAALKGI